MQTITRQSIFEQAVLKHLEEYRSGYLTPWSDFYFACLKAAGKTSENFAKAQAEITQKLDAMREKGLISFGEKYLQRYHLPYESNNNQ